jgi:hypothetical protein
MQKDQEILALQQQLQNSQLTNQALQQEFTGKVNEYNEQLKKLAIVNKPSSSNRPQ